MNLLINTQYILFLFNRAFAVVIRKAKTEMTIFTGNDSNLLLAYADNIDIVDRRHC